MPSFITSVPYPVGITPTSVSGCTLWLDADDASTITYSSGSNVSAWADKSGNAVTVSAFSGSVATAVTYSNKAVYFSGGGGLSNTSFVVPTSAYSVFAVFSNTTVPGLVIYAPVISGYAGSLNLGVYGTSGTIYAGPNQSAIASLSPSVIGLGSRQIISATYTGSYGTTVTFPNTGTLVQQGSANTLVGSSTPSSSLTGISCVMIGGYMTLTGNPGIQGLLLPSSTAGTWYAVSASDLNYCKMVKLTYTQGTPNTVSVVSAAYATLGAYPTAANIDAYWAAAASIAYTNTASGLGYGVQSLTWSVSGASGTMSPYVGGETKTTVSGATFPATGLFVAVSVNAANFIGTVSELLIYNTALATAERQQIEAYLAKKWSLTVSTSKPRVFMTKQVYPSFLPVQLSNCALWLDGSDPLATGSAPSNGTAVNSWKDKSGNSANGTITSAGTVTYSSSSNGLYFNGAGAYNLPNGTITPGATNFSIFVVCNLTTFSNYPYLYFVGSPSPPGSAAALVIYPTSEVENGFWTDFMGIAPAGTAVVNTKMMFSSIYNSGSRTLYKNGTSVVTGTFAGTKNTATSPTYVGYGGSTINGIYNELIVYNYFLPTSQRQQVEGYLAWKYGMQGTLSNTHPYYAAAPSAAGVPANPTRFFTQVPYSGYSNVRYVRFTGGLNGDNWQDIAELSVYGPTGINLAFGKSITQTNGYTATNTGLGVYGVATSINESSQQISGASLVDGDITTGLESQNYIPVIDLGSNCLVSSASIWLGKFWGRSLNGQFDLLSSSSTLIKRWTITDTSSRQITWKWPN